MSTKRTCPACNEEVMQGDEYCASCGASLSGFWMNTWTSPPPQAAPTPAASRDDDFFPLPLPATTNSSHRRSRSRIALIIGGIIVLGGALALAWFLMQGDDEQDPQTSNVNDSQPLVHSVADTAAATGGFIDPIADRIDRNQPTIEVVSAAPGWVVSLATGDSAPQIDRFSESPDIVTVVLEVLVDVVRPERAQGDTDIRAEP